MRLDHIAFRVLDRNKASEFLQQILGYRVQAPFTIDFDDGTKAECVALEPIPASQSEMQHLFRFGGGLTDEDFTKRSRGMPEMFVSDGQDQGGIVGEWVAQRGVGGIHHIAFQVQDVEAEMKQWKEKGVEFSSEQPIKCPEEDMVQIFTKPIQELGGVVIELIQRTNHGFCRSSVKKLMESSVEEGELT